MGALDGVKLVMYAGGLAFGQLLFKMAAVRQQDQGSVLHLILDPFFVLAVVTYFGLAVAWVMLLRHIPLTRAYPFSFLSLAFVLLAGWGVFGEPLGGRYLLGVALVAGGLTLISSG